MLRLRDLAKEEPSLRGLRGITYLGYHNGVAEYAGHSNDGPVLVLRVTRDDPADVVENLNFAYHNTRNVMGNGAYTVPVPLSSHPAQALLVLRAEMGTRLHHLLHDMAEDPLDGLYHAGAWLAAFHNAFDIRPGGFTAFERLDEGVFPYRRWLEETDGEQDLFQSLADFVTDEAEALDGKLVDFVKFHRTFAPRAVHLMAGQTTSTDLQNTKRRPRAHDLAHFLVEAAFEAGPRPGPRDEYGLPDGWSEAFLSGYGRQDAALTRMLRFCIIVRMIEVYAAGEAQDRQSKRYLHKREILKLMVPSVEAVTLT
jgi:hypothetical protein